MEIYKITQPQEWIYFAKGQANILFKYIGPHDYLKHKLLRIRLLKEEEEYISTCELYDFIELKCKPLFPKQIIDIQLVVLTTDFLTKLNTNGNKLMLKERYGLLIPNMLFGHYKHHNLSKHCDLYIGHSELPLRRNSNPKSPTTLSSNHHNIDSVIFEIKPKWLYDNSTANYCRTCLLGQVRQYQRHFCPLDLLYDDTAQNGLQDLFKPILDDILGSINIPIKKLFEIYLSNPDNVFQKLKQYQKINDESDLISNIHAASDVSTHLSLVMTLRDVGLFLKFEKFNHMNNTHTSNSNIDNVVEVAGHGKFLLTCNIYDLDLKSNMKYRHWRDVENKLQPVYNSVNPEWRFCTSRDLQHNLEK